MKKIITGMLLGLLVATVVGAYQAEDKPKGSAMGGMMRGMSGMMGDPSHRMMSDMKDIMARMSKMMDMCSQMMGNASQPKNDGPTK